MSTQLHDLPSAYDPYVDLTGLVLAMFDKDHFRIAGWTYRDILRFVSLRIKEMDSIELIKDSREKTDYFITLDFDIPTNNWANGLAKAKGFLLDNGNYPIYSTVTQPRTSNFADDSTHFAAGASAAYLDDIVWVSVTKTSAKVNTRPLGLTPLRHTLVDQLSFLVQGLISQEETVRTLNNALLEFKPENKNMVLSWSGYHSALNPLEAVNFTVDRLKQPQQSNEKFTVNFDGKTRLINISNAAGLQLVGKNKP
jgi:hypothetical protein